MANLLTHVLEGDAGLLNHLGDGKHLAFSIYPYRRLLNHLGDGKRTKCIMPTAIHLLNHLGDGKRCFGNHGLVLIFKPSGPWQTSKS